MNGETKQVVNTNQKKPKLLAFRLARGDSKNIETLKKFYRTKSASQVIRLALKDVVDMMKSKVTNYVPTMPTFDVNVKEDI